MIDATLCTFRSSDGYVWYYRRYLPVGRPIGRIVFLHGIRSHGGWYTRSCTKFAAAGFEIYFLERRGCGLNTSRRGDAPNFRRLFDDVSEFLLNLRQEKVWLPIHLAGISWGGKLAAGLPYRKPGLIDSLVMLCPGLCPKIAAPFLQRVAVTRARLRDPTKLFPIPLNDPDYFTSSPEWQTFVDEDRFGLRQATARFLFSSVSLDLYLKRAIKRVTVPTLLLLAGQDRVIDNVRTRKLFLNFAAKSRTIIDYPDAHHTLEFEPDDHPFVSDVVRWLSLKREPRSDL